MKSNIEIREKAKQSGVKLWEIAERIGLNDGNFSRKLRKELSEQDKTKIIAIINEIATEKKAAAV